MTESLLALGAMLTLVFLRVPVAFAMALVGFIGLGLLRNWHSAYAMAGSVIYESGFQYLLSVLPLFILMGNFVTQSRMSRELYTAAHAVLGHRRGGLAMSTIVACGGFGAICGSSLATAATMAKVAYPEMRRIGYSEKLAAGSIAAGGTLGILIPPSIIMVVYCLLTEQSIGKMFAAGVLPGLLAIACYMGAVAWVVRRDPAAGPKGERSTWPQIRQALGQVWSVLALIAMLMGGIYAGVFTPAEAAGIGAFLGFVFACSRRSMSWRTFVEVVVESAKTTGMIFLVMIGALMLANFINFTSLPGDLLELVERYHLSPLAVIFAICGIYIVLGCVLESMSMILLTVPVFYPLVQSLGFDLIWFGIIVVVVTEISFITPPFGMNVFVLRGLLPGVSTQTIFRGVAPFVVSDIGRLTVLILFPAISLYLPQFVS
ncbi:TRAP transporter large permease [Bordetella petrii]|uniref:TRAP transporter large permease protein n=1 Tax=Bordetella petrii (strain ATCC BAA-461 / DSM 12804 / CCUG 43448 / CIP 107267 / Se-1111R) TaxID=340100 RepID=A9IHI6_BORPD|nr:TRAP transporter large permease [Bordetella petrii]CAP45225.1 putative membrane protein (C4-dicarboxylate transport system, large permease component) [Bordetella petrii]